MKKGELKKHSIRNQEIRDQYLNLRRVGYTRLRAIDVLRSRYPYLQIRTIRNIAYGQE